MRVTFWRTLKVSPLKSVLGREDRSASSTRREQKGSQNSLQAGGKGQKLAVKDKKGIINPVVKGVSFPNHVNFLFNFPSSKVFWGKSSPKTS